MKKDFLISNLMIFGAEKIKNFYFSGCYSKYKNHCFYFNGTLYESEKSEQEYFDEFLQDSIQFINRRKGDFIVWDYNIEKDELFFATDRMGKDNIYYYCNNNNLILTNNFWKGISLLNLDENYINWLAVKSLIIHHTVLLHETIVVDYNIVPPATYGVVLKAHNYKLVLTRYWEMTYKARETSMQETISKVYTLFDNTFKLLSEKYDSDIRFGIGLSGGWDSRLIVSFAQKYNLNIVPYCIGEKYLLGPIKTNGYKVSKKLAKFFGLNNFKFIEYSKESYLEKAAREIELTPNKASNIEIGCFSSLPEFDIMLNGEHGGVFFGEFDFKNILDYTSENIEEGLLKMLTASKNSEMIMNENDICNLKKELKEYVSQCNTKKRWEIYYKYFFEIKGSKSKDGFFETNYGTKPRYSMYLDPEFVDEYLTWDPLFLVDRTMQRAFFEKYFNQLSRIEDETTDAPLHWRSISIRDVPFRTLFALKNYVFKSSLRRAEWIKRDKGFKELLYSVYKQNEGFIRLYFPNLNIQKFYQENPRATANFVKVMMVIDVLLSKREDRIDYIISKYSK